MAGARPAIGGQGAGRIPALDLARGAALVAMAVYHLTYDLEMFGHLPPGTAVTGGWAVFARLVAGSFLFLAGVSLFLAHREGIRWASFMRRLAVIGVAAAAVSLGTWAAMPDRFVYFGILHSIAAASIVGLAFLRMPAMVTLAAAVAVVALARLPGTAVFDSAIFWPLGLSRTNPPAIDYVPLVPWLAPFLAGIAAARIADRHGLFQWLAARPACAPAWTLWPGRHSLVVYLVHQPVLIGLVWAATQLVR
ncbi:putative membrane protein [Albidovulum inexpectatum]|uniref:Putative membrane protein n=1 Tax=Albidovulum inexpectatum TaxID=196587 RepID=A0A2S5JIR9_9RHOB|nr:heparan-alpha-glucosaminide N-acetyltransferase [Albidovulum inexpectatum]PPB81322.1 putative membrane protein [Albidovulum inexpectatum]